MPDAKHTPGPWQARKDPYCDAWPILAESTAIGPSMRTVARVSAAHHGDSTEKEANARLIAAAPDLLAELIKATDLLDSVSRSFTDDVYSGPVAHFRAAIARAQGKE